MVLFDNQELYQRQVALEKELLGLGVTKFRNEVAKAREQGIESTTVSGIHLLRHLIDPVEAGIQEWITKAKEGAGRRHNALLFIQSLEPEVLAYIVLKHSLNQTNAISEQNFCIQLGMLVEDELKLRCFRERNEQYFKKVMERVKGKNYTMQRRAFHSAIFKYKDTRNSMDVHITEDAISLWDSWSRRQHLLVGAVLHEICTNACGILDRRVNLKGATVLSVSYKFLEWMEDNNNRCEYLFPALMPMVSPPLPWTNTRDGGYYTEEVRRTYRLMKVQRPAFLDELENADIPIVYSAINAVSATPWKINTKVYDVMYHLWYNTKTTLAKMPMRGPSDKPPAPIPKDVHVSEVDEETRKKFNNWKAMVRDLYDADVENRSRRSLITKILFIAERFKDEDAIYFPHNMDFRGRFYPLPTLLSPQGSDFAKSLLMFAEGKPITEPEHADWFYINGANLWGYDKVSMDERIDWAADNIDMIRSVAEYPMDDLRWCDADKPFQFLAWCFEAVRFEEEGFGFVSHIPVGLDGSCNGLQHLSAILRDEVCGSRVNLTPSDVPSDIYGDVAKEAERMLVEDEDTDLGLKKIWLDHGITRDVTKRGVMVLPYGGTFQTFLKYIEKYVSKNQDSFPVTPNEAAIFLGKYVWPAVNKLVVGPMTAMQFLRSVVGVAGKSGLPICWTTPVGLPIQQGYLDYSTYRVKTVIFGAVTRFSVKKYLGGIDINKQRNGIAPNFIHSLDAACLQMYVDRMKAEGITSFMMVHDNYGVHASDTPLSARILRDVFVEMYSKGNVLQDFLEDVKLGLDPDLVKSLPTPPPVGNLDINDVKESVFFFA